MTLTIDVHFDYRSPFAYLASKLLPSLCERTGAALEWKPIDLLGLSNFSGGMPYSDKKRAYVFVDVMRSAEFHGVEIRPPKPFPVEPERALCLALAAKRRGVFEPVHEALFEAAWHDQQDLQSDDVLGHCADASGLAKGELLAAASAPECLDALRRETAASDALGVFGVPTFVVSGELFWGIDSLPVLEWRLAGAGRR